jgi:hypothetical protein
MKEEDTKGTPVGARQLARFPPSYTEENPKTREGIPERAQVAVLGSSPPLSLPALQKSGFRNEWAETCHNLDTRLSITGACRLSGD